MTRELVMFMKADELYIPRKMFGVNEISHF